MRPDQSSLVSLPRVVVFLIGWICTALVLYAAHLNAGMHDEPDHQIHWNHLLICAGVVLTATGLAWLALILVQWLWTTDTSFWLKSGLSVLVVAVMGTVVVALGFLFLLLHLAP